MKRTVLIPLFAAILITALFNSCKKTSNEVRNIYVAPSLVAHPVKAGPISGAISGTMLTDSLYTVVGDVTINKGDTLWLQPGVTVCIQNTSTIIVKGALISLGTQAQPNWFTVCDLAKVNSISQSENPSTDPAWNGGKGWWTGINCDTSCTLLVLKWTHIEFTGATFPITEPFAGGSGTSFGILFQNPLGDFIMEDSWIYGTVDDAVRIENGRCSIMRNTFEKQGYTGGDCINAKAGSVGDMAYNLFTGTCTNGTKASNKGTASPQCQINMYNNTYICGGYRRASTGRGGSINYEQGARGLAYNNLIVNCEYSLRVLCSPIADTANMTYTHNYAYGDSTSVCNQFFPVGYITRPDCYIVPPMGSSGYIYAPSTCSSTSYDASSLDGKNNPLFVNFPLPMPGISHLYDISYVTPGNLPPFTTSTINSYDFHLQYPASPAIGIGFTGFSPVNAISAAVKATSYGPIITPPGVDMGCFQTNGTGNQH